MTPNPSKVLFILKRRDDYNAEMHSYIGLSTGLYNSAMFVNDMLNDLGVESHLVVVTDNNDIDREVNKHKPTHVIIEALWVVPEKFKILSKLHPNVQWIIRLHSELPFLANEGMAMGWIAEYSSFKNLVIACNSPRLLDEIRYYIKRRNDWQDDREKDKVIYLPNYYPHEFRSKDYRPAQSEIHIGCFGAIRPLKNQLMQAVAAIEFADDIHKRLVFHLNSGRIEMKGLPVLHNVERLFEQFAYKGHRLVNHEWAPRQEFLAIVRSMDLGMQVSFTETFNIVAADFISQGIPLVGSKEIPWTSSLYSADPVSSHSIVQKLHLANNLPRLNVIFNRWNLANYTDKTKHIWNKYFHSHGHTKPLHSNM